MTCYLRLAQENLFKNLYLESIKFCNKQIDTGNKLGEALMIRSMAKAGLGFNQQNIEMIEEAINDATESIKHNPDESCAYKHRARLYAFLDDFDATEKDFNKSAELEPSYENFLEIGAFYQQNRMFEKSVEYFKRAINADNKKSSGYSGLGASLLALDLYEEAEKCFEQAKQLGDVQAYVGLAKVKAAFKQYDDALKYINEALTINPILYYAHFEKGLLHLKKSVQKSKKKGKLSLEAEFACYKQSDKINKRQTKFAIEAFEIVNFLQDDYLPSYLFLMLAYNNLGKQKTTIKIFDEIAEKFPVSEIIDYDYINSDILSDLTYIFCLSDNGKTALDICNKYLEENPNDAATYLSRGEAQYYLGNFKEAKDDLCHAKELGLDNKDLYLDLGTINYTLENGEEALKYLKLAAEKDIDKKDDNLYFIMTLTYISLKRYQEALNNIDIAISINPKDDYLLVKSKIEENSVSELSEIYYLNNPDRDAFLIKEFCKNHLMNLFNIDISI